LLILETSGHETICTLRGKLRTLYYEAANSERTAFTIELDTIYRTLIQITDADKREYYELAAANNGWTARELERQKNS